MNRRLARLWVVAAIGLSLIGCSWTGGRRGDETPSWHVTPMPAWEEAFHTADPRWRGADGAYSVPLSGSSTLWLFGDTWITEPEARGRDGGVVIRNSVGLQEIGTEEPGRIEFYWREEGGEPKAPFVPPTGPGWLWPLSGERLGSVLYLFFSQLVSNDSALGFEISGAWLFRVPNPEATPAKWELQPFRIPFFEPGPKGDLFFGVGCVPYQDFLYVYGIREDWAQGAEGRSLLVARTPFESLEKSDFTAWRFFSGDEWTEEVGRSTSLFQGAATEMSVSYLPGRKKFLAVYSHCGLSEEILARLASHPAGPWGEPVTLHRCPEVSWKQDYFCYAGKAHPELATKKNEMIVTYAVNSWVLDDHHTDLRLYWPRFIRVVEK